MIFWSIAAAMIAVALALVLRPLARAQPRPARRAAYDLAVYRDQLAEIDRDIARGLLTAGEAAAARTEIERRLLAAAGEGEDKIMAGKTAAPARPLRWLMAALATALPLGALALYLAIGHPELPAQPLASRSIVPPPDAEHAKLEALVQQLSQRMAADPRDPKGWLLLGRSYSSLGRFEESANAFAKAIERGVEDAPVLAAYGEALTMAADGQVTQPALKAFEAALAIDPEDSRARYYQALARAQSGKLDEALDLWVKLEADAAPGAPWLDTVGERIDQTARALGRDPATLPGRKPPPAGPTAADMQAAARMSPEERETFIRGMVDRLAQRLQQQPGDTDGWIRLATSYTTLGDPRAARDAWAKAAALAPDRLDVQQHYAESLIGVHLMDRAPGPFPAGFAEVVQRIRALDPESGFGLFYGGALAEARGDKAAARALWEKLLPRLPAGSPEKAELQRRLDALAAGG